MYGTYVTCPVCLDQMEFPFFGGSETESSDESKFAGIIDKVLLNPNRLSKFHREILTVLLEQNTNLGPAQIAGFLKSKKLHHETDSVKGQLTALKKKGYVESVSRNNWVITNSGRESLENDIDFRFRKVIVE